MEAITNYIDGRLIGPISGKFLDNIEPATGRCYGTVPDSDSQDIAAAVAAAQKAFPGWSQSSIEQRAERLNRIADLIEAKLEVLADAESRDNGKPVSLAKQVDIPRACANFRFFASAIRHDFSESHSMGRQALNYTLRSPLGVVACISPWNLPLYLFSWKIAPALAMGNTVVAKPSELTPLTAFLLSQICIEAGLAPGVLNVVHGIGTKAGQSLVEHPSVQAVSFTGGTKTGGCIANTVSNSFKKLSLEMGGKNPNIIFADCNLEKALDTTLQSSFFNQGEVCLAGSRIFVEQPIYDEFKRKFVSRTEALKVSDPMDADCEQGALVSEAHLQKVLAHIEYAKQDGGTVLTGGKRARLNGRCKNGFFVEPTVVEGLSSASRTNQQEIFGPVVSLIPFETEQQVVEFANSTRYGLAASIWSENIRRCHRLAEQIQCGVIWINCWMVRDLRTPFGGMKHSGVGREGGFDALHFFTETKNICVATGD